MKKLILSVAMLCATSMLFAQAPQADCLDCSITQLNRANNAIAGQNTNQIDQLGIDNAANVYQNGNGNHSKVNQSGSNHTGGFFGWSGGDSNTAMVSQTGTMNESDINQLGDDNMGKVWQNGYKNYAMQTVGIGYAEDNIAEVKQVGHRNESFQKQRYDNNEAYVNQKGGYYFFGSQGGQNYAEQDQSSMGNGYAGSIAHITQNGNYNEAKQVQRGSNNDANSTQTGNQNMSVETQNATPGGSASNYSSVTQTGFTGLGGYNDACVQQDAVNGRMNTSFIAQTGSWNESSVIQNASAGNNWSTINQTGFGNMSCVEQLNN